MPTTQVRFKRHPERDADIVRRSKTQTNREIGDVHDMTPHAVRAVLAKFGLRAVPAPRSTPREVVVVDPLFFRCGKGHPLTRSNIVAGTEKSCLVCMKASQPMPFQFAPRRDELIAELLETIAREVDELTADLRPELAVAS